MKKTIVITAFILSFAALLLFKFQWGVKDHDYQKFQAFVTGSQYDARSKAFVGCCFFIGKYVEKDVKEAFKWFKQSADFGSAESKILVGKFYYLGIGVDENKSEGLRHFFLAVSQDKETKLSEIGIDGGIDPNNTKTIDALLQYFKRESQAGNVYALEALNSFNSDLTEIKANFDSIETELKAAFNDNNSWIKKTFTNHSLNN